MISSALGWIINDPWLHELLLHHLQLFAVFFVVDALLRLVLRKGHTVRWFYLHALGNGIVSYYAWPHFLKLAVDPVHEIVHPHFFVEPTTAITVLHVYHVLAFQCKLDEWMHHIVFVVVGVATQYTVNWGRCAAMYHFFVCGLPGGIDYLLLALVKEGAISKELRLRCAVELNMWLRAPGIVAAWAFAWAFYARSPQDFAHTSSFIAITLASVINAQYYSRQVALAAGKQLGYA